MIFDTYARPLEVPAKWKPYFIQDKDYKVTREESKNRFYVIAEDGKVFGGVWRRDPSPIRWCRTIKPSEDTGLNLDAIIDRLPDADSGDVLALIEEVRRLRKILPIQ